MVYVGIDPHKQLLVAVVMDEAGHERDQWQGPNNPGAWDRLLHWAAQYEPPRAWGIEGSGGYGRGLAHHLVSHGEQVWEVNPRLVAQLRRRQGSARKTDQRDALAIARVVRQEGEHLPVVWPADQTTIVATLAHERQQVVAMATRVRNQLHQQLFQLDPDYRRQWPSLTTVKVVQQLCDYPIPAAPLAAVHARSVRRLAERLVLLTEQIGALAQELQALTVQYTAPLRAICGVGPLTAALLAGYLGPGQRFVSDAKLAAYAGVAPLETGSAGQVRHRLNRDGQRELNAVVHRIALTQLQWWPAAQAYVARRQSEGKTKREAIRALKRYIVRAIWHAWQQCSFPLLT